jgi:signal transduction histidine kinase
VKFVAGDVPESLGREVSLSLFRVVQEALYNAIKYSGQKHFEVSLEGSSRDLSLEVRDHGVGFDPASRHNGGLGLLSMAERIHQVNGTFSVDSRPNSGTCIRALVPLALKSKTVTSSAN